MDMIQEVLPSMEEHMVKQTTALEKVKELQEQMKKLSEEAKEEALAQAEEAVETLNALGYPYSLTLAGSKPRKAASKRAAPQGECTVCGFATDKPHDARSHRNQGDDKRPFTPAELEERGLVRI